MRLWTLSPSYLDSKGLVALWREGLLAKAVQEGNTRGYQNHPQLIRFRAQECPLDALCCYLHAVLAEARSRGYHFDADKLPPAAPSGLQKIKETDGQLAYEWQHLMRKLQSRNPARYAARLEISTPQPHPFFQIIPGNIATWEKIQAPGT